VYGRVEERPDLRVDGAPSIEFRLTNIIPSIRKLHIAHKIPTL
jgi:hypothetical protein